MLTLFFIKMEVEIITKYYKLIFQSMKLSYLCQPTTDNMITDQNNMKTRKTCGPVDAPLRRL